MEIKLRDIVKDEVTGFIGMAVAKSIFLNGCVQFAVTPQTLKDGMPQKNQWFDVEQLSVVTPAAKETPTPTGGPHEHPPARSVR